MKKIVGLLFLIISFSINVDSQTLHTIDSLGKVKQACLDKGIAMIGCAAVYKTQMDSLIELSLKKLYAKGNKASNLALKKDQSDWLRRQKIYNKKVAKDEHNQLVKDGEEEEGGEVERLIIFGDRIDFVVKRAKYLVKKLNSR